MWVELEDPTPDVEDGGRWQDVPEHLGRGGRGRVGWIGSNSKRIEKELEFAKGGRGFQEFSF